MQNFNKDLLVKTFDVIRKEKDREINRQKRIIEVCLEVGRLSIYPCAEKGCEAIWITDKYGCGYKNEKEKGVINAELMGICNCGEIRCSQHSNLYNERLLCDTCFEYRKSKEN